MTMQFSLTEEQQELAKTVRAVILRRLSSTSLRDAFASQAGYDEVLWKALCGQVGVTALSVPENMGGLGFTSFETHIVLEELGRTLTPSPLLSSGVLGVQALLYGADAQEQARLLPELAEGAREAALCWADEHGRWRTDGSSVIGRDQDGSWYLDGVSTLVLGSSESTTLLVVASTSDGAALFEADPASDGVTLESVRGVDPTMRFGTVRFDGAAARRLGGFGDRLADLHAAASTAITALQVGGAQAALDRTVAHLSERVQFGRPLASFQALKHRCADMLVAVETARSISWAAAWAAAESTPDMRRQSAIAASWCSEAFSAVAREMVQMHGGIAITWEHDAHLYFKRAHSTAQLLGAPHEHRRLLGAGVR
ncbi:acyl-CoA dehydrogenase family protein [Rhodococcus sovatensis]|uniref:Acyl-CoA dehydrogenase family protein n=1 Tax=Rhodococcus sovatensis TaxID=1805840 RepID=A0ABZ2PKA2_9NOCA